jgi:hypothetical protein
MPMMIEAACQLNKDAAWFEDLAYSCKKAGFFVGLQQSWLPLCLRFRLKLLGRERLARGSLSVDRGLIFLQA